jgi:hypothetical protein
MSAKDGPAVLLVGGPLAGWGFRAEDWDARVESARARLAGNDVVAPTDRRDAALGYVKGGPLPDRLPAALQSFAVTMWRWAGDPT